MFLTGAVHKVGLGLGGGRGQQLVVVLVGAEGARVVPLARVHHGVGHHDVAQRVVQVAVQQAALVLGRRHVVVGQRGGRAEAGAHRHDGRALLLDHAGVHDGLVELLGAALRPLGVVPVCTQRGERRVTKSAPTNQQINQNKTLSKTRAHRKWRQDQDWMYQAPVLQRYCIFRSFSGLSRSSAFMQDSINPSINYFLLSIKSHQSPIFKIRPDPEKLQTGTANAAHRGQLGPQPNPTKTLGIQDGGPFVSMQLLTQHVCQKKKFSAFKIKSP